MFVSKMSLWPPLIPEEGGGVAFAGFPGHERIFEPPATFNFAPYPALTIATSVSERQISCQIERDYLVRSPGFGEPPLGYDFGGMSGGPLFNTVERGGVLIWYLGGVLKEGHADLEILTASRADFILRDGALRH